MAVSVTYKGAYGYRPLSVPVITEAIRREADRLGMDADFYWTFDDDTRTILVVAGWNDERRTGQQIRTRYKGSEQVRWIVEELHEWYQDKPWLVEVE